MDNKKNIKELCLEKQLYLLKLIAVITRVQQGESLLSACRSEKISYRQFRYFINQDMREGLKNDSHIEDFKTWEDCFLIDMYGENSNVCPSETFYDVFEHLNKILEEREIVIINEFYKDKKSLAKIGSDLGITGERAGQIKKRALLKIRNSCIGREFIKNNKPYKQVDVWP